MSRHDNYVTDLWHELYTRKGLCSLCGNSGRIDTRGIRTNAGVECGDLHYCICPNGQVMRQHTPSVPQIPQKPGPDYNPPPLQD